jgi:uncharacterized protein (TIGR02246 family)
MFGCRSLAPLVAVFLAVCLGACSSPSSPSAQPADTRAADADAIRAADIEWNKAMQARDVDKSVSFYADDAILLANKNPVITDHQKIRKEFEGMLSEPSAGLNFTNTGVEVARSGDLAWDRGTYEFTSTDKSGKAVTERGKYLTIWRKQADGSWKAIADMDNTDQ